MFDLAKGLTREDYKAWPGEIPLSHVYTVGVGAQRFFETLKERGEISGSVCPSCQFTLVPGRLFCEVCLMECTEWYNVGLEGELISWTSVAQDAHGKALEKPVTIAFIRFPKTQGGLMHFFDAQGTVPKMGLRVRAHLKDAAHRIGAVTDIIAFRPI